MNPLTPIIFCLMIATIGAEAHPYQETHLSVNGIEQMVGTENPQILKIQNGQVFSTIHIEEPETISCTLENCVANVQVDNTFGGYVARISGTMTNQTSQIQLLSQGQVTYTIVMETKEKQIMTQETQNPFGIQIPNQIPNFVWGIFGIVGVIAVLLWSRGRGVGKIVTI